MPKAKQNKAKILGILKRQLDKALFLELKKPTQENVNLLIEKTGLLIENFSQEDERVLIEEIRKVIPEIRTLGTDEAIERANLLETLARQLPSTYDP